MARRKKQDEGQSPENVNDSVNQNSDDTFGLPEIEYRPLNREQAPEPTAEPSTASSYNQNYKEMEREEVQQNEYNQNTYYDDDDGGSPWPKILGVLAVLIIIGGGIWYFGFERPKKMDEEKARLEREAEETRQKEADQLAEQKRQEDERRRADSLAQATATPATGVIDTLTERTGRYYVIIASAVDGDLIVDYARKLAPKGLSPKIIPPYGKVKFYRLAIAEGDTYASTQATADQLKGEYSEGTWVVKY